MLLVFVSALRGWRTDAGEEPMADLLHEADHTGIARVVMLKAIRARAAKADLDALGDICEALGDLDEIVAEGDWFGMVRRGFWLAARAEGGNA